ncbi:MAG: succinyl-diaminopimelate desuccinylase [Buchnera aphidicola (Eriosoma harunire)]
MLSSILELTKQLVQIPSISPFDLGCQDIISNRLSVLGFKIEKININDTSNLWAERGSGQTLTFLGHTDVVPPGNLKEWFHDPFEPVLLDNKLFGRGVVDMKGSIASMIIAVERFIFNYPNYKGRLSFIITSDEESSAVDGTVQVVNVLRNRCEKIDFCLVGEPTSLVVLGDMIKYGRRGSLTAHLLVKGVQGHIAYPHLAANPIHLSLPFLLDLQSVVWDTGNAFFSPTSMQIYKIKADTGCSNVIPSELFVEFNFRFNTELSVDDIKQIVEKILNNYNLNYSIKWFLLSKPFVTSKSTFINKVVSVIESNMNITPILSTDGGTSDGRFLSEIGVQVVELGLINASIHKVNECVEVHDLYRLSKMYEDIIKNIFL